MKTMKIIKIAIIVMTSIMALILIIGAFAPNEYAVERAVTVNRPKGAVYDYIKYLKNQDHYSAWSKMDPKMRKRFKGEDGKVGFISAWESENPNVGKGEQEILEIIEGQRINYRLRFIEPFEAEDNAFMAVQALSDTTTRVVWGFSGKMDYPMNMMLLFMSMEAQLAPQLQEGLDALKTILEAEGAPSDSPSGSPSDGH